MTIDVSSWSETPASNTTVDGVNIAEACSPSALNNMGRAIMAGVKTFHLAYQATVTAIGLLMPKTGGTFSGTQPKYDAEGAFMHHASSANLSGRVYLLPEGSARPVTVANGDMIWYYTP